MNIIWFFIPLIFFNQIRSYSNTLANILIEVSFLRRVERLQIFNIFTRTFSLNSVLKTWRIIDILGLWESLNTAEKWWRCKELGAIKVLLSPMYYRLINLFIKDLNFCFVLFLVVQNITCICIIRSFDLWFVSWAQLPPDFLLPSML